MRRLLLVFTLICLGSTFGCDQINELIGSKSKDQSKKISVPKNEIETTPVVEVQDTQIAPSKSSDVLAKVNGRKITDAEVYERVKNNLKKLESQIFDIKRSGLDYLVEETLLEEEAAKRNVSVDDLLKAEIKSKAGEPSEAEIQSFYEVSKRNLQNQPLEKVKNQVIKQLKNTKERQIYADFMSHLRKKAEIEIFMERPRVEITTDDDPSQGKSDSPIILIEFSDFQCPFCKKTRPTIQKIMETYKGKVYYVFKDFPLSFHKNAPKASEAANCAGEQEKYWEYNTKLWDEQRSLELDSLKTYAKELGLNEAKFNKCLDSGKYAEEIDQDIMQGSAAGVSGTPAYFINGIFLSGAQPFEAFQPVIEEELARLKK